MAENLIILVGGPETGKTNYLGRLWIALRAKKFQLKSTLTPENITYVDGIAEHVLQGKFAPRTEDTNMAREFQATISSVDGTAVTDIVVPDMKGEIWQIAVRTLEIPPIWLNALKESNSAVVFLRARSPLIVQPLDWVVSQTLIRGGIIQQFQDDEVPTQVSIMELLRFLDENLRRDRQGLLPKVALVVTAWDVLDFDEKKAGPMAYIEQEFPLLAARLKDQLTIDVKVFGSSIVGGDLENDEDFMNKFLADGDIHKCGYVICDTEKGIIEEKDVTEPIRWLLE
jgi:hypothetical protein